MKKVGKYFWEYSLLVFSICIFILSFILGNFIGHQSSLIHQASFFEKKITAIENDFQKTISDTALLSRLVNGNESDEDVQNLYRKPFRLFLYKNTEGKERLVFWSTASVLPSYDILYGPSGESFIQLPNGYYYAHKQPISYLQGINAYGLILLKYSFYIETNLLKDTYPFNPKLDEVADVTYESTPYSVKSPHGKTLFYIKPKANTEIRSDNFLSISLRITGLLLFFIAIYFIFYNRFGFNNYKTDTLIFLLCIAVLKIVLYLFTPFFNFDELDLFNPEIYSSGISHSLGNLLIDVLLYCFIGIFLWKRIPENFLKNKLVKNGEKWFFAIVMVILLVTLTLSNIAIIRSLIKDSKISFDVTNVFSLSLNTAFGFIILASLALGYYYFSKFLYRFIFLFFGDKKAYIYFIISIIGLLLITFFAENNFVLFYLFCLIWLLLYTLIFENEKALNNVLRINISGFVFWIFFFSLSISMLMLTEIRKAEIVLRKLYLEKLANQTDTSSEKFVGIATKYLDNDFLKNNFYRLYNDEENSYLRDSILSVNYEGYQKKYSTEMYFFDSLNRPMPYNPQKMKFEELSNIISHQSKTTSYPELFFYDQGFDNFSYITRRIARDNDKKIIGSLFIISNSKKFAAKSINAELFRQVAQPDFINSSVYFYAIYNNGILTYSSKKYPFASLIPVSGVLKDRFELKEMGNYNELWYKADNNRVIVMTRKSRIATEMMTLFSYVFCSFLLSLAFLQLLSELVSMFIHKKIFKSNIHFFPTIRKQIHGTLILVSFILFIIIAVATISFFTTRFQENNKDRLSRAMNIMLNELQRHENLRALIYTSGNDSTHNNGLRDIIKNVSDIHGLDVNIYDLTGKLRVSSQEDIYGRGILSTQMSIRAYYKLLSLKLIEYIQTERISDLSYLSIYGPVKDSGGRPYAYLSIPFFTSEQELNQEISSFVITLINLYAFVFLVTGLLALLIANRITRSLMLIGEKMREVTLAKNNQQLVWNRNDEIGVLVTEYNKMVLKLQDSADTLAQAERREAWREMARQIAHEIKNPLTPMKLSLQYLQKAINEKSPNVHLLTSSVTSTLVEQIDHLSRIATNFSQFANIDNRVEEVFDLHQITNPLCELYSSYPKMNLVWSPLPYPVYIKADKTQMNRLFTNLIANAIEASSGKTLYELKINEIMNNKNVIVSITDNGSGISDTMEEKIFTPNFTTKSSGTGLGLAISKNILENAGGKIWFQTKLNEGTTFYVELPVVEPS